MESKLQAPLTAWQCWMVPTGKFSSSFGRNQEVNNIGYDDTGSPRLPSLGTVCGHLHWCSHFSTTTLNKGLSEPK